MTVDRAMRLLHLIPAVGPTNGQYNEHCLPLRHDRRITICSVFPAAITPPAEITLHHGDGSLRGYLAALDAALADGPYDVVHAHAAIAGASLMASNARHLRSMAGSVYTVQNSYLNYRPRNRRLLYPLFAAFQEIVVCSRSVLESLPGSLRRSARGRITVVQNAVDTERVARVIEGLPARENDLFTVASVGRLIPIKRPQDIVDAMDQLPDGEARLTLIGEGELRPGIRAHAEKLGMSDRVEVTGLIDRDDVYRRVGRSDAFVSASAGEGLPVAVLEQMACGVPGVLSDIPPHREIVDGTDLAPLVPVGDVKGFARAIGDLRDMTRGERTALGVRCRREVEERFGLATMHRALGPVYARAAAAGGSRRTGGVPSPRWAPAVGAAVPIRAKRKVEG
jgi:glycosyltransferase involved in cell wall biosynthesis